MRSQDICWVTGVIYLLPALAMCQVLLLEGVKAENLLFARDLPSTQWAQFSAAGFSAPVSGVVFHPDQAPCCGVPLGGVATGCLDVQAGGVLGFETIFNQYPRRPQLQLPFLGLAVEDQTYVFSAQKFMEGGKIQGCVEPNLKESESEQWCANTKKIEGVHSVTDIHYFGHYPIVDMEYSIEAPIDVALRAWSPFVPGDVGASNIPAAVFEVQLVNKDIRTKECTLAFSFPGIPAIQFLHQDKEFHQRQNVDGAVKGLWIRSETNINYFLGIIGTGQVRTGGGLHNDESAWSRISGELPTASALDSSAALAVDFPLEPGKSKTIRFVLAWYSPVFCADPQPYRYTNYYATRYANALEVAQRMAKEHESLLKRILAWQEVIYADESLPIWLRDTLINNLCLITETAYWAAAKDPLGDWCYPEGYFAMNESPRGCSHIECIPCTWYGNMPINYFFPQLARTTLRAYTYHQREDGAAPFDLGPSCTDIALMTPSHEWQKGLNSFCFVDMVDRLWMCTEDRSVLDEFYPAVKKATQYTVAMCTGADAVISLPDDQRREWWEGFDWYGMTAHAGALRISNMYIAERMASAIGDEDFAEQCREWQIQGQASMEEKMWNEKVQSYSLFHHAELGKRNETIMANQFDGEWNNLFHGLPGIFRKDRLDNALKTIKKSCLCDFGAVSFAKPDLTPLVTYGIFPPEIMILGYTSIYAGDRQTGMKVLHDCMHNLVIKHGVGWDLPNMLSGAPTFSEKKGEDCRVYSKGTGEGQPTFGTDYYQNMILWAAPAAMAGTDLAGPCKKGGLIDRIIRAGNSEALLPVRVNEFKRL